MNRTAPNASWRIVAVRPRDFHMYELELERDDGETAYVDVQAWDDVRARLGRVALLGAEAHPVDQDAAQWVEAQCEDRLAGEILTWRAAS